jgi:site-specific recombinase XerD
MSDPFRHLRGLDALTSLAADRMRLLEQMRPQIELAREYQELMRPLQETVRRYEEAMRPLLDAGQRAEEAMRPLLEAGRRHEEAMRPLVEAAQRHRETFRHFTDAIESSPALALAAEAHIPQLQIAERLGKTMALSGVVDDAKRLSALSERWREAFGHYGALTKLAGTGPFAEVQRFAESVRLSMPEFPALDPALFGSRLNADFADAFQRFREHAESVASDPDADLEDVAALVADAEAVNAAAPPEARSKINGWVLFVFLWLLDKAAEDPAKELIHEAIAVLVLVLTTVVPPAVPQPPALPVPGIENPAASPDASETTVAEAWQADGLPDIIRSAGPAGERATLEFLNDGRRSANTKQAYANAAMRFLNWCEDRALHLEDITPFVVRAYVKQMQRDYAAATVKQHLAAIRLLFDHLVVAGVLPLNPATGVRPPQTIAKPRRGGAAVLRPDEARRLLDSVEASDRSGLRDRALLGAMLDTRARVSGIVAMDVKDYGHHERGRFLRLRGRDGKKHEVPVTDTLRAALDIYMQEAGIGGDVESPLWRTMTRERGFSARRMSRVDVFRMIRRRARAAGLEAASNCDSLRVAALLRDGAAAEASGAGRG